MKITAKDIYELHLIERVIPEKEPASSETLPAIAEDIRRDLDDFLKKYLPVPGEELAQQRYERFRRM